MDITLGMLAPFAPLRSFGTAEPVTMEKGGLQKAGNDFAQMLNDALIQVDALQKEGDVAAVGMATGQIEDAHTAIIALQKAQLSLSLTVEVRNKILDAYNEVMRMQI
jgi:flagellar hook-basal body complex protein FliE